MNKIEEDFRKRAEQFADETRDTPEEKYQTRHDYLAGEEYGYQYALQHPQWIPVEERLPKENQTVFICNARRDYGTALYQGGEWLITREYVAINVTHWMEIVPPARKED